MSPVLAATGKLVAIQGYLADGGNSPSDVDPTTGKGPEWGEAAPIGLLVVVVMCVAVYFLVKSMNRNLKKVPESFATVGAPSSAAGGLAGAGGTSGGTSASSVPGMASPVDPGTAGGSVVQTDSTAGPDFAPTDPAAPADPR